MTTALHSPDLRQTQRTGPQAPAAVVKAVQQASARTGVDFSYLMEKAAVESGYRTDVKAGTSSATGLFQFIDSTWLDMVKDHGAKHGLDVYANSIERRADGSATVDDPKLRREILNLRKDPRLSALLAGELAKENQQSLEGELNRPVGRTELYMAHFLGAGGAAKFLKALEANPDQPAHRVVPAAARANINVFYDGARPRSLGEVFDRFAGRFGEEGTYDGPGRAKPLPGSVTEHQPWLSTRSAASGKEPLNNFTIMQMLALMPPGSDTGGTGAAMGRRDDEQGARIAPNMLAGLRPA